jgi:tetratricopeptide (TPR) repeat protein
MGDIFKGIDQETGEPVAIKLLRTGASAHDRARFGRELAILADLRHPNIVQYIAHGTWHDGRLFFAMEWLDGEDLSQRQRRAPLGMRDAVEVVRRAAAAMAAVHARGVVHRDLKLSNIYLVRERGTQIKLIDFGVVKPAVPDEYPTERGTIIGTPHFMAPEQARGEAIDARADVYSLGAVLFRLITGRNIFETEHVIALLGRLVLEEPPAPSSIRFDVPEALDQVIMCAIARAAEHRFSNGGELARTLARVGTLNNDAPATDRSASAIRKAQPEKLITETDIGIERRPIRPGSQERRVVAVVLFDLAGHELTGALDAALRDVLGDDIRLEHLAGGQLVTVLGVERSKGDEAMRAARAALTLTQAMPLARAAVAVGHAVRGRGNLAGQGLERAARHLAFAAPGRVRVDAHAAAALEGRFVLDTDGDDAGGSILVREDVEGFGARQLLGRATPTVGREKEVALLQGIFSELVDESSPRAAIVTGQAGIGKSRVRSELVQRLELATPPPEVLVCRGDPLSHRSSLSALGRALRARMGIQDGEDSAEQIQKVKRHLASRMPRSFRFLSAFLGELVGVPFPDEADEPLRAARASAQLMQSRLRMALEALVRAQAEAIPQILLIEDLHWTDDTTLELVDDLLGCPGLRFGVFGFGRPEIVSRVPPLWQNRHVTRVALSPLAPMAAERLVGLALPDAAPATRTSIVERAGGNALFLEELVRAAADGRGELPLTVHALLQLRLDRMQPNVREVLRAAAVFGQSFWTGGVNQLVERDVEFELNELFASEIIARQPDSRVAGQDEWHFRQALVRDVAYATILDEDRQALHLAAGAWLELAGDMDAGLMAHHAEQGGALQHAAALYARATRQAFTNGAQLDTVLDLAHRGLTCGAEGGVRAQLLLAKAQASNFIGRLEDGREAADEAARLAPPASDMWGEAERLAASSLIELGRSAEGDQRILLTMGPELSAALSAPMRAKLLSVRVRALVDLGRPTEALHVADEAVFVARSSSNLDAAVRALDARLYASLHVGDGSGAIVAGSELIRVAESAGDVVMACRAQNNLGSALNQLGRFEEAILLLEASLGQARSRRLRILEAFTLHNLGMSRARLGDLDRGIAHQNAAFLIADETGAARLRIHTRIYEANFLVWRAQGADLTAAHGLAKELVDTTRHNSALQTGALFTLARVQLARGAVEAAVEAAREANHLLSTGPIEEWEDFTRLVLVEALLVNNEFEEADAMLAYAFSALIERARRIQDAGHQKVFLSRLVEITRLLELAKQRLGLSPPLFSETTGRDVPVH